MRAKPLALHRRDGTYRRDRHANKLEVEPGMPTPLFPLDKAAQRVWDTLAPMLLEAGVLTPVDCASFTRLCALLGQVKKVKSIDQQVKLASAIDRLSREFGLSPDARGKLRLPPAKPTNDDKARFFMRVAQ